MKPYHRDALAIAAVLALQPLAYIIAEAQTSETNITYAVVDRAADTKTVQSVTTITQPNGYAVRKTNSYVEIAPGMHYQENGQWKESRALIEILPGGTGAIAKYGRHKVTFAPDINTDGAIDMTTADGKRLRSHILGLGYYDTTSGDVQFFAVVQSSDGLLSGTNQVIYTNAFDGVLADVRYTYRRSGFEQDVILREQPASPTNFKMNAETTRLVVFTEFMNPPIPVKTTNAVAGTDLVDETLSFGKTKMIRGKAFPLQNAGGGRASVPTAKSWITVSGRTFLIEEVKYRAVEEQLQALPDQSSLWNSKDSKNSRIAMSGRAKSRMLAAQQLATLHDNSVAQRKDKPTMTLASIDLPKTGYVLDYVTVESGATDFTFQANTTYYIVAEGSGGVVLNGNTTIGAGAVIKSQFDGMGQGVDQYVLYLTGTLTCPTDLQNPAIFTDWCDDSVGAVISGSSGYPNANYPWVITADNSSTAWELKNVIFKQGMPAFYEMAGTGVTVRNCQFIGDTAGAVTAEDGNVYLGNVLMAGYYNEAVSVLAYGQTVTAENVTADLNGGSFCGVSGSISYKNCLLTGYGSYSGNYYSDTHVVASPAGLFASGPLGNYFLAASSSHRNVGTAPSDSQLASDLPSLTTYAPPNYNADTDTPDRGFHYPIITDADHDGMADAWELAHFGTLNRNGTGDYDKDGVVDFDEFRLGEEPNDMRFLVSVTNNYVSTSLTRGGLELRGGVPFKFAIVMDSTNFSGANWLSYPGTNLTVPLGTTEGWHEVWIGLRGRAETSRATWQRRRLKLDTMPPLLVITKPVSLAGSRSLIQIQGYATEALASSRYDLSNAAGIFTNRYALVGNTFFNTNTFEYTTNYFQCYDVDFAIGSNVITFHVTDKAGNVTTTNTTFTLAEDLTAPVIRMIEPQNGDFICGETMSMKGLLDDISATISATVTYTNGTSTQIEGIIGREGEFWIESVPLQSGSNEVSVICTDPWGNTTTTNFAVVKSSLVLAMNPVPPELLWRTKVTVTGTVSDSSYRVFVNDVEAEVTGNSWTAQNVPVSQGGTGRFVIVGYSPGEPVPSGGGGGN